MSVKGVIAIGGLGLLAGLGLTGCTPDWANNSSSPTMLLMTAVNGGRTLQSDVRLSNGSVCADFVDLRLENHMKNPGAAATGSGFRHDLVVERYEIQYYRSDGRNTEGVDVPYTVTGNLSQEVIEESAATLPLEVVRIQAKLEPPLLNLVTNGGSMIVTNFAKITLHARTTIGEVLNPVSATLQIDFANYGDSLTTCPAP